MLAVHVAGPEQDQAADEVEAAALLAVREVQVARLRAHEDIAHHPEQRGRVRRRRGRHRGQGRRDVRDSRRRGRGLGRRRGLRQPYGRRGRRGPGLADEGLQQVVGHGGRFRGRRGRRLRRRWGRDLGDGQRVGLAERPQLAGELRRRLVALLGVAREGLHHDGDQRLELRSRRQLEDGRGVRDLVEDGHDALAREGAMPGQELVEHAARAPKVGAAVHLRALHLLGRHVVRGAHDRAGARGRGHGEARHSEVHDLHRPVHGEEDVGGLDVAVDDAGLVRAGQPVEELHDDVDLPLQGQGRVLAQRLEQVHALEQLHRDVGRAVVVVAEVEDGEDVGVDDLGHRARLALEAALLVGVPRDLREHDLQGHVALEQRVARMVDDAHGAPAHAADDLVLPDTAGQIARAGWLRSIASSTQEWA